jgi:hypothetical protein
MWVAYFKPPLFFECVSEMNWWVQIFDCGFIVPIYLFCVWFSTKKIFANKDSNVSWIACLISFLFPKLWFFSIPAMLIFIDEGLSKLDFKKNYLFYMQIIVFALLLGQCLRVGVLTYNAWSYTQESNCYLVNHEYLARVQGEVINTNQATIYEYNECLKKEGLELG